MSTGGAYLFGKKKMRIEKTLVKVKLTSASKEEHTNITLINKIFFKNLKIRQL